jgi:hypothetical protein
MHGTRFFAFALWITLAGGWTSAFFTLGSLVGGVKWIAHTRQVVPAGLNLLMAALCAGAAIQSLRAVRLPSPLAVTIAAGAALHMLNILGLQLAATPLAMPFILLATVLPTNPFVFRASNLSVPVAIVAIWSLPVVTLAAALVLRRAKTQGVGTVAQHDA